MKTERTISSEEALIRLQYLCSAREKCTGDVREKLRQWNIAGAEKEKIIDQLKKDKFIDDLRFVGFFVRDKQKINKWGREKIRYALKIKGFTEEFINEALSSLPPENYEESLRELLKKKSHELNKYPIFEKKKRLISFAAQRGFDFDLIFRVIDDFVNE